jgi:hypothetical protein
VLTTISATAYVFLLATLAVGAWRTPPSCLAALYCMFALDQLGQSSISFVRSHPALTNIAVGGIVLLALYRLRSSLVRRISLAAAPLALAVGLYVYALCSTIWTPAPDIALSNWSKAWPYIVVAVLLTPPVISDLGEMRAALRWMVWVGGSLCLVMLFAGDWGSRGLRIEYGLTEFESNPLAIAAMAGSTAIAALLLRSEPKSVTERLVRVSAAITAVFLIIRSGSRGELIAMLAAVAVVVPIRFQISRLRDIVASVGLFAIVAVGLQIGFADYKGGGDDRWSEGSVGADTGGRFAMAATLLSSWARSGTSIVFGLGNSASFDSRVVGFYPHVMPAEILGEEGIVGAAIFLSLLCGCAVAARRLWRATREHPAEADTSAAIIALVMFAFIVSSKEGSLLGNYIFFTSCIIAWRVRNSLDLVAVDLQIPNQLRSAEPVAPFSNLMK